ncbi:type I-F CRISPR-associated endoribonuclease Cas6/Csy4 [Crenothrix sp. D3]|nr:type I-F CRISPR-associated endoribonuclease Cas6/Csy4 [Crenothrix sp. D3]
MKHYLDITLLPDPETPLYFLWEKVYQQLHLALVAIKDPDNKVKIGVAFPHYDEAQHQLGCKLRLLAPTSELLEKLNITQWLSRLSDYVHISSIKAVPEKITAYAVFKRIQLKTNTARLAKRKAKRESITPQQALANLQGYQEKTSRLPYIYVNSQRTKQRYRLLIARIETSNTQITADFSCYGLSSTSPVPVF